MPRKLATACRYPGCAAVTHDRYCPAHARQEARRYDQQRGTAAQRGYDARWQWYRRWYLAQHPLRACGCGRPSTDVDHIQPVSGPDDPLFWNPANHQALAHGCHSAKTARSDGRWRGARARR